ncbi:MAG: ferrochelatase [Coriobacteriia bacterium]|nr:ferrochelatase [Coriobacteriia bacterium]
MLHWLALLTACVLFGAAVVAILVLPRGTSALATLLALATVLGMANLMGVISSRYDSPAAMIGAAAVLIAGVSSGYGIAASALPHLAGPAHPTPDTLSATARTVDSGVLLLSCTEPDQYSPRSVALRQSLLSRGAEIDVPANVLPFVFFAEKARYRTVGGLAPGPILARRLAAIVAEAPDMSARAVTLAWCHSPTTLRTAVTAQAAAGASRIAVVVLGQPESGPLDEARTKLDPVLRELRDCEVVFGSSIWNDQQLADRLVERILEAASSTLPDRIGVVLVNEGCPPVWERRYTQTSVTENYFNQRVRARLGDAGIDEKCVRVAWIDWQNPDVTEAVRHVAALGSTSIVVAPSTIALPTLETALDLRHAVRLARVPDNVRVVVLPPWGDDDVLADAIRRSANEAFEER